MDRATAPTTPDAATADATLDQAAALRLFVTMNRALRAITGPLREQLKQFDLSPTEFGVLEALYHKGPLPQSELADRILVTCASTTYTVKGLEERGLLRRRASTEDHRFVITELTPTGRKLIARAFTDHAARMTRVMRGLSMQEKRTAAELMKRLGLGVDADPDT